MMFASKADAVAKLLKGVDRAHTLSRKAEGDKSDNSRLFTFKEQQFSSLGVPGGKQRESAVLILLRYDNTTDGHWQVLLTLRPQHMRFHPGLTCLPGGKLEPGEDSITCAMRESHVGINISF